MWFHFICKDLTFNAEVPPEAVNTPPRGVNRAKTFTEIVHRLHKAVSYFVRIQSDATTEDMERHHFYIVEYARAMEHNFDVGPITT